MKTNPVFKREVMISSRSFRLAMILLVFNGVLALVALLNMYSTLAQVRLTAEVQYTSFLDLYLFVAVLEFMMLIGIMPALTAGSIRGERERPTLELMLATKMRPAEIDFGKLGAALSTMLLLIVSSFPILAMVFVYGGVTMKDIALLLFCFVSAALFVGSLGLCCSALFRRSTLATVAAYALLGGVVLGTYGMNQFAYYVSGMRTDGYLAAIGQSVGTASSGNLLYLLLVNPAATFILAIGRLTGRDQVFMNAAEWFGSHGESLVISNWVVISLGLQIAVSAVLVWVSVKAVSENK